MKHIVGMISQALVMGVTYVTVLLSLVFDAIIFALPVLLIYNFTLVTKFGMPELNYFDIVGLVFLIKIMAVLWKSIKIQDPLENNMYVDNKQLNE